MLQHLGYQLQSLYDMLALASRPTTQLDTLLKCILGKALAVTGSHSGGGLFIFETSGGFRIIWRGGT